MARTALRLVLFASALPMLTSGLSAGTAATADPAQRAMPGRINLPDGWQPEGIATDGSHLYVGSLANGAIWKVPIQTGTGHRLARGQAGRVAVGLEYDARHNLVWVAGGDTNKIRAHNARTGRVRAVYDFPSGTPRFLNDLVVTARGVYATDSMNKELAVVPFDKDGSLPGPNAAQTLPLTGDLVNQTGFNLNGIVKSRGRLLAVQTNTGRLFRIDKASGQTLRVKTANTVLTNGDGLEIRGDRLWVVRNQNNRVVKLDLNRQLTTAVRLKTITSAQLDVPSTVAAARGFLWAVNARFNTNPTPNTKYWITRLQQ
jgi:sugar lactone lactonase YvrE